uniref:NB-ARC domain-containing protein n=1 Tax=Leersia perrieri TaxID=77586 RepID=A0A0D9X565_9ORYZ
MCMSKLTALEIEDNRVETQDYRDVETWLLDKTRQTMVIALTSKSGTGKTTLASYLYWKKDIRRHFTCFAWANAYSVSDYQQLDHTIIATNKRRCDDQVMEGEKLIKEKLAHALQGERYLIVLDDVQSLEGWPIKITGEDEEEPKQHGCYYLRTRELKRLNYSTGGCMLKIASSLPLNIVLLAGLLRSKKDNEWEGVIDSLDDALDADETQRQPSAPVQTLPKEQLKKNKWKGVIDSLDDTLSTIETRPQPTLEEQKKKTKQTARTSRFCLSRFWHIPTLRHVLARRIAVRSAPDKHDVLTDLQTLHGVPWNGRWARSGAAIGKMTNLRSLMAWNVVDVPGNKLLSALASLECLRLLDLETADENASFPLKGVLTMLGLRQLWKGGMEVGDSADSTIARPLPPPLLAPKPC